MSKHLEGGRLPKRKVKSKAKPKLKTRKGRKKK